MLRFQFTTALLTSISTRHQKQRDIAPRHWHGRQSNDEAKNNAPPPTGDMEISVFATIFMQSYISAAQKHQIWKGSGLPICQALRQHTIAAKIQGGLKDSYKMKISQKLSIIRSKRQSHSGIESKRLC